MISKGKAGSILVLAAVVFASVATAQTVKVPQGTSIRLRLSQNVSSANAKAGEKMWRMPLDDEYREQIRSSIADIVNSGGRWGGAITAAMFLKEFAEETPWIHLDIAGTAWMEDQKPWIAKGPSGIALRSLVEFVKSFAG